MIFDLTKSQKSLYNATVLYGNDYPINIGGIINFKDEINIDDLKDALNSVVKMSPNLRTIFKTNGNLKQEILTKMTFNIDIFESLRKSEIKHYFNKPFDVNKIMFRYGFIKKTNSLIFSVSHLISDGYTMKLLNNLLIDILNKKVAKTFDNISIILDEEEGINYLQKEEKSKIFFKKQLNNVDINVKPHFISKIIEDTIIFKTAISASLNKKVSKYLTEKNHSFQTLLIALFGIELKISNGKNIVKLGTTLHNRNSKNKNVLGVISKTYPIVFEIKDSFEETLTDIRVKSFKLYKNKTISYEELIKVNENKKLFSLLINVQEKMTNNDLANYEMIHPYKTDIDLSVNAYYDYNTNSYEIVYISKSSLFNKNELKALNERLLKRLNLVINNNDLIDNLNLEEAIDINYNSNSRDILEILDKSFKTNKTKIALKHNNQLITYKELEEKVNIIASKIISLDINNEIILIDLDDDINKIISLVAIIKSNNIFTFLPKEEAITPKLISELKIKLIINNDFLKMKDIVVKNNFKRKINRLCVYNTSGTTKRFKSIVLSEEGVINYILQNENYQAEVKNYKTILNLSDFSFDISLENILLALFNGKTLILSDLLNTIDLTDEVDFLSTTPSVFKLLISNELNHKWLKNLKTLVLGGEVLTNQFSDLIKSKYKLNLYNSYGPTECCIAVTTKLVTNNVTLGSAIKGTNVLILNNDNKILPNGYAGNIAISGKSLGLGYLNNDNFTITINKTKHYLTNDIGYIDSNLELNYLGRLDNQIKRNGVRIELDYIDNVLNENKLIISSKTIFKDPIIISYFNSNSLNESDIFKYLTNNLPSNYLPNKVILTNNFTLNNSGKSVLSNDSIDLIAKTKEEELIYKTIKELLNIKIITKNDTLIQLGGGSIEALTLITILNENNIDLSINVFMQDIKISEYYKYIKNKDLVLNVRQNEIKFYLNNKNIKSNKILLLGATGFLGMHLLHELYFNNYQVAVIARANNSKSGEFKIKELYKYYFNEELPKSIVIVEGEITKKYFGLEEIKYNELLNSIDTVINSAAKVDFIGKRIDFESINFELVKHLENESKKYNFTFYHISTTSLGLLEENFCETSFYNNNNYSNLYLETKRQAEDYLINNFSNNHKSYIIRVGNLMPRQIDNKFQINKESNLIYQLVNKNIKVDYLKYGKIDVSAVDLISKAILSIINNPPDLRVLHLYNPNLLEINKEYKYPLNNDLTLEILKNNDFVFPKLKSEYLKKIIDSFKA